MLAERVYTTKAALARAEGVSRTAVTQSLGRLVRRGSDTAMVDDTSAGTR